MQAGVQAGVRRWGVRPPDLRPLARAAARAGPGLQAPPPPEAGAQALPNACQNPRLNLPALWAAQALPYNLADAVQYPSAAEMERRWVGRWEGRGAEASRGSHARHANVPAAPPGSQLAAWSTKQHGSLAPCCRSLPQVRELPGTPLELPGRQLCGDW